MDDPDRDRFLLSKGHGPMAYYAVLAAKGFIPARWLDTFGQLDSPLGHHPDRVLVPGVEISSGSLGHGLPIAVGVALSQRQGGRTYVLVGDAELDEGANHEAIAYAGATGLERLTAMAAPVLTEEITMRSRFVDTVTELLDAEPATTLVLANISAALFTEQARRHPDRVLNVGIRESLMVSVGGGLALTGLRPVIHSYAPFLVER